MEDIPDTLIDSFVVDVSLKVGFDLELLGFGVVIEELAIVNGPRVSFLFIDKRLPLLNPFYANNIPSLEIIIQ